MEQRLAYGHITASALLADDEYILANFPNTGLSNSWMAATDGVVATYQAKTRTPSRKVYALGLPYFDWRFSVLNREQVEYLIDTIFPDGGLSSPVTVMTYRFNNQSASGDARDWCIVQATAEIIGGQTSDTTINVNDLWYQEFAGLRFTGCVFLEIPS